MQVNTSGEINSVQAMLLLPTKVPSDHNVVLTFKNENMELFLQNKVYQDKTPWISIYPCLFIHTDTWCT